MLPPEWKQNYQLAMDAQPSLISTPSAAIPAILTTFVDPDILRVLLAPLEATEIFEEVRKGSWVDQTLLFPVVERTGVVSSYGDWNNNGAAGINTTWEGRGVYNYQVFIEYGDQEMERMGLARINYASELKDSAINTLTNYQNLTYFYGVAGQPIYGILNDPSLPPPIAPALKAYGNNRWVTGNSVTATALEVFNDILGMYVQLVRQTNGTVKKTDPLLLCLSPAVSPALDAVTQYNVNVSDILKKSFPGLKVVEAVQYGASSASNPQGNAVGEVVQLIAPSIQGQKTGMCSYPEKLRAFPVVRHESSFRQKMMQGTSGAVIRYPAAVAQMVGV